MTYYNTVPEDDIQKYQDINKKQDSHILNIAKQLETFGASDVYKEYVWIAVNENILITSVRRSIHTLKEKGYIEETGNLKMGMYGRREREYQICGEKVILKLF